MSTAIHAPSRPLTLDVGTPVLVVAADEVSSRRITECLEPLGFQCLPYPGDEALIVISDASPRLSVGDQVRALSEADTPIVVAAADAGSAAVRECVRAGAAGFVSLEALDALGPTLRAVLSGQSVIPRPQRAQLQRQVLTAREKQTLALVVMGLTNGEIAARLYLAESTVKSHLSSAFSKLGVRSRNEAAALILDPSSGVGMGILTIPTENAKRSPQPA